MEKEVLEVLLKKVWKEDSTKKIISIHNSPAVAKFQNFLSTVNRLTLKVVLGNGRIATRSLIEKVADTDFALGSEFQKKYDAFRIETMIYQVVLKEMEYIMEEFEDTEDILWCKLVHYIPYTRIVMEDLKASGHNMLDRTTFLDIDHSMIAVNSLARFHGMSKVLEERGILNKDGLKPWFFCNDLEMHQYLATGLNNLIQGIKKYWNPSWVSLVNRIKLTADSVHEKLRKIGELDTSKFNVLCHGDCNKNNLMFKYDWKKRPISMRFLDFQIPFYGSPSCDLSYLLSLSVDPFVRRDNYDLLVKTYHTSLCRTLDRYKFTGCRPSLVELQKEMEMQTFLRLFGFLAMFPPFFKSEEMDVYYDFEKVIATQGKEGYSLELYKCELLEKAMGPDLEKFVHTFF